MGISSFFNMKQPKLGAGQMLKFLSNVNNFVSPSEGIFDVHDTILMLGSAFISEGDKFIHKWKDVCPEETHKSKNH